MGKKFAWTAKQTIKFGPPKKLLFVNPPRHALSLGHKTWFCAEGEAFLMTISKMKHAEG